MLMCTVPYVAETIEANDSASTMVMAVIAAVSSVAVMLLVAIIVLCFRNRRRRKAALFHPIDDSILLPIRKRVVLMHSNLLYSTDTPGSPADKGKTYGSGGIGMLRTPLLMSQIVPQVRIEPCCTRSRLSSELTSMSEYEIPLDKHWEFPRSKYVAFELIHLLPVIKTL